MGYVVRSDSGRFLAIVGDDQPNQFYDWRANLNEASVFELTDITKIIESMGFYELLVKSLTNEIAVLEFRVSGKFTKKDILTHINKQKLKRIQNNEQA